jgi:hypothetical protein
MVIKTISRYCPFKPITQIYSAAIVTVSRPILSLPKQAYNRHNYTKLHGGGRRNTKKSLSKSFRVQTRNLQKGGHPKQEKVGPH